MGPRQERIYKYIKEHGRSTRAELVDNFTYVNESDVDRAIKGLVDAGHLEKVERGVYRIGDGKRKSKEEINLNQTTLF